MKLAWSWLQNYTPLTATCDEVSQALTALGIEVEGIEKPASAMNGVFVGLITNKCKHPQADKLSLLSVDIGSNSQKHLNIVCGAQNMQAGDKIALATIGTTLANGLTLKRGNIRGKLSEGMCCSEAELGIADEADGILILPQDSDIGTPLAEVLQAEQAVFDLSITPNRGDCMSMHGLARELAAWFNLPLSTPIMPDINITDDVADIAIDIRAEKACPKYLGRRIDGVNIGQSPKWMQQRLLAMGMRPINAVVDVMNYIMLELGQPMHSFDAAKVEKICVRHANAGEVLHALDGRDINLQTSDLVISDANAVDSANILALAGVMGSEDSGVTAATQSILLESAVFDAATVCRAARRTGMVTEASMRFERGIDANLTELALQRATSLIIEFCGGRAGKVCHAETAAKQSKRVISMPKNLVEHRLGVNVPETNNAVLKRMGFIFESVEATDNNQQHVNIHIPTWRHDVRQAEDMVEEYARVFGYDNIPAVLPQRCMRAAQPQTHNNYCLHVAVSGGFLQVITYAFISEKMQRLFVAESELDVVVANPISETMSIMRRSLWSGMLQTAAHNINRGQRNLSLVEQGRSYAKSKTKDAACIENDVLAWLMCGQNKSSTWHDTAKDIDFFSLKGVLEDWFAKVGLTPRFIAADNIIGLQTGQAANIVLGKQYIGCIGRVDAKAAASLAVDIPVFVAEVQLGRIPVSKHKRFIHLPEFPAMERDLVFALPAQTSCESLLQQARKAANKVARKLLEDVSLFDRYSDKSLLDQGQISMGIRLSFRASGRTLTQQEVDAASDAVIKSIADTLGGSLR
ncbi:MAG: phenylalanine--tRNA ligase subunit beta [Mariprofundales bacterium]